MDNTELIKELAYKQFKRLQDRALEESCKPLLPSSEEVKEAVKKHLDFNKTFVDTITPEKKEE